MKGETFTISKPEYRVIFIKPCVSDRGKKTAEAFIKLKIDIDRFYKSIKNIFNDVKYSKELGLIKINSGRETIFIFDSGKVIVRKAKSERDVIEIIETLVKTIKNFSVYS